MWNHKNPSILVLGLIRMMTLAVILTCLGSGSPLCESSTSALVTVHPKGKRKPTALVLDSRENYNAVLVVRNSSQSQPAALFKHSMFFHTLRLWYCFFFSFHCFSFSPSTATVMTTSRSVTSETKS